MTNQAQVSADDIVGELAGPGVRQYLTFFLGEQAYGVDILQVQSIQIWESATPVPNTPDYLLGVLNLRGAIVPVVDLKLRLKLEHSARAAKPVVVVFRLELGPVERIVGVLVDAVSDVCNIPDDQLRAPPAVAASSDRGSFVSALVDIGGTMTILLDASELVETDGLNELVTEPA